MAAKIEMPSDQAENQRTAPKAYFLGKGIYYCLLEAPGIHVSPTWEASQPLFVRPGFPFLGRVACGAPLSDGVAWLADAVLK